MSRVQVVRELLETEPSRVFSLEEIRDHLVETLDAEPVTITARRIGYYAQIIGAIPCWGVGYRLEAAGREAGR